MHTRKRFMENAANIASVFGCNQIRALHLIIKNIVTSDYATASSRKQSECRQIVLNVFGGEFKVAWLLIF